jgi:predicted RNA methylase
MVKTQEYEAKEKGKDRKHAAENPQAPAPQIVLNAPTKMGQPNGRPAGSKSPKTVKKTSKPVSASLIKENLILATKLNTELNNHVCKKFNLEKLNEEQDKLVGTLLENIMVSEEPNKWIESIEKYLKNPDYVNQERFEKVIAVGKEMELDDYSAAIIYNSQKEENEKL